MTDDLDDYDLPVENPTDLKKTALNALRKGDFNFALSAVERGEASIPDMVEDLKIYQVELEIQNQELRAAQLTSEKSIQRFSILFASLPIPALVINEFGVVIDSNIAAEQRFHLNGKFLRSHFFPRLVKNHEHARLHQAIELAKFSGGESILEIDMQPVNAKKFIADIHISFLPDNLSSETQFAVIVADQTERLEQRDRLDESRRHFMAYFDSSPMGMAATNPKKEWIEVNEQLCQMLGYDVQELMQLTWLELTHADDVAADTAQFNRILAGEIDDYNLDKRFIRKDGSVLHSHLAVKCIRNSAGNPEYFVTIIESIETRKRAELALIKSKEALYNKSIQLRARINELRAIYAISRSSQQITNLTLFMDEVLANLPLGMLYPEDVSICITVNQQKFFSTPYSNPVTSLTRPIKVDMQPVGELMLGYHQYHNETDQEPFYPEEQELVNTAADLISGYLERKREHEARILFLKRNATLLELNTKTTKLSDSELLKYAIDKIEDLSSSQLAYVHFVNDDQKSITASIWSSTTLKYLQTVSEVDNLISKEAVWMNCLHQKQSLIDNNHPQSLVKKVLSEENNLWIRHMTVPIVENDKIVMIVGVGNKDNDYDDSDLALLELIANHCWALLQRNRSQRQLELHAEVFRNSREAVIITDASKNIISVNSAFTELTGYTAEEVIGQNPKMLSSGKHDHDFYAAMWAQIDNNKRWQGEIWNRKKNGELLPQWLSISSSKNEQGEVTEYIGIALDISDYKSAQERIQHLAYFDSLTNLPNRTLLKDRAQQAISMAKRQNFLVGILFLDLDHFKDINDVMGHLVGDELLVQMANRISSCIRDSDTVSRMGGDEFVVLLNKITSSENVIEVSQKILNYLAEPFQINQRLFKISCSIGASVYPDDGENFDILLQHADTAMYQAKNAGRNTYKLFTDIMDSQRQYQILLRSEMRHALENNQIYIEYQPQYNVENMQIIGVEALVRWCHPTWGILLPNKFIPICEESELIIDLGLYVMREACKQAKRWLEMGHRVRIAVNISYIQFLRNNLLQLIKDVLIESQLPSELLELELTESILAADPENVLAVVDLLRDEGVYLSIDDFGTGYSSLSYLKRFPVHKLKIDQSFIRDLVNDRDDRIIVSAIINLAKSLEIDSIAEGVETEEQANLLRELGCKKIQGFWLAKPLSVEEMNNLLSQQGLIS